MRGLFRWANLAVVFVLIFIFVAIFQLNCLTDFTSDDIMFHFFFNSTTPISSTRLLSGVGDVIPSVFNHYQIVNGRIPAHIVAQFFCLFDKSVFNIANSVVFTLVIFMMVKHIEPKKELHNKFYIYLFVAFSAFLFIPHFGLSALWLSGASNYLWMILLVLLFLYPYRLWDSKGSIFLHNGLMHILILVLGLLAGASNENGGGLSVLFVFLMIIKTLMKRKRFPLWFVTGLISAIVGLGVQVLSPGNSNRILESANSVSFYEKLGYFLSVNKEVLLGPCILLGVGLFIYIISKRFILDDFFTALIYIVCAIAADVVLFLTPSIPHRAFSISVIFIIIAAGSFFVANDSLARKFTFITTVVVLCFFSVRNYVDCYENIRISHMEYTQMVDSIVEQREKGIKNVVVKKFKLPHNDYNALSCTANLTDNKDSWFNLWMAKYYNVDTIIVSNPEDVYKGSCTN